MHKVESESPGPEVSSQPFPLVLQAWFEAWGGDLDRVEDAVAEHFISHAAPLTGGAVTSHGRETLRQWIARAHGIMDDLTFTIEVGPIVEGPLVATRWHATGVYNGRFPEATAEAGQPVEFHGIDILRIVDGVIEEYWASADGWWLLQQLGIGRLPATGA